MIYTKTNEVQMIYLIIFQKSDKMTSLLGRISVHIRLNQVKFTL